MTGREISKPISLHCPLDLLNKNWTRCKEMSFVPFNSRQIIIIICYSHRRIQDQACMGGGRGGSPADGRLGKGAGEGGIRENGEEQTYTSCKYISYTEDVVHVI